MSQSQGTDEHDDASGGDHAAGGTTPRATHVAPLAVTIADDQVDSADLRYQASKYSVPHSVRAAAAWSWRGLVIGAATFVIVWVLAYFSDIVVPIVLALLLTALLQPAKSWLARWLPPILAAITTVVGMLVVVTVILSIVGAQLVDQFSGISKQLSEAYDQIRTWVQSTFGVSDDQLQQWLNSGLDQLGASLSNIGAAAASAGLTATHLVTGFFLMMFTLIFFLYDGQNIWHWVVRLFPRTARAKIEGSGRVAWAQLTGFTRGTVIIAIIDAVGISAVAAILGVPFVAGIAVIVFFGAFIPIIGATISGAVAVLLALVALGPIKALIMLAGIIAVQQIEAHVLQPLIMGKQVRLHPLAIIVAIAAGVSLAGVVGGVIAVPLAAVVDSVWHYLLNSSDPADAEALDGASPTPD